MLEQSLNECKIDANSDSKTCMHDIPVFMNITDNVKYHFPDLLTLLGQNQPESWMLPQ